MDGSLKRNVFRVTAESFNKVEDVIAVEKRLKILVNGKEVLSLYCTPLMIKELVVGFFMTEGIVKGNICAERMTILYGDEITVDVPVEGEVSVEGGTATSGCAGGITLQRKLLKGARDSKFSIGRESLIELFKQFQMRSKLYRVTGCVHSAALSDGKDIVFFAEDIGRHNAVDKVIGRCLLEGVDFQEKIILTSGRLSSEVVAKCSRWGIPLIASRAAPTDLAINIAEESGITVVGFLRGERMNVYTYPERIKF
jgi:FdhD protein